MPVDPPGRRFVYSNPGYALAGLIVERVSEEDLESFILREVFGALGTEHARLFGLTPAMVERVALPYLPFELAERLGLNPLGAPGRPVALPQVRFTVYPAGDAYMTPVEMGRFLGLVLNHGAWRGRQVLDPHLVREATTPQAGVGSTEGLGWVLAEWDGRRLIEHSGGYPGYSAYLRGDPETGFGVFVAATSMGDMTAMAQATLESLIQENAGSTP